MRGVKISNIFENRSLAFWLAISVLLVGVLGVVDFSTGNDYSFSLFYLLPISLTAWYANRYMGIFTSILSAAIWVFADVSVGEDYSRPIVYFWNLMIRLGFFLIVTYLLSELRNTQMVVRALSRADHLTGVANTRYFQELLETEMNRAGRYNRPFTLMYLDIDNFKQVNDTFGHEEGDNVIACFARELRSAARRTDFVARMGGDEFVILFPELGVAEAGIVASKIFDSLNKKLKEKYAFLTLSVGVVTYTSPPDSTSAAIRIADEVMYTIKKSTKNGIGYSLFTGVD